VTERQITLELYRKWHPWKAERLERTAAEMRSRYRETRRLQNLANLNMANLRLAERRRASACP